jgi:predicted CXXCH cytochrome family protein
MQCTSCHDPHIDLNTKFLVASTRNSVLCNSCHTRNNWATGSHNTSTKTWNGTAPDPWPNSPYTTVAENGCASCHQSHNSGSNTLLMKSSLEEANCMDCHNGNGATKNLATQMAKTYRHNVAGYNGVHDPNESSLVSNLHVECSDCHNPHEARNQAASAPAVNGFIQGVKGVTQAGAQIASAANEYEICYRCHAGTPGAPVSPTNRVISQNNTMLEFAPGNPSYHAVATQGINTSVPSLIAPWSTSSRMYCGDCHGNNDATGTAGPHGSTFAHILKKQYITTDPNSQSEVTSYALCFTCHNQAYFTNESTSNSGNFRYHFKHVADKNTPCNTCHDPHGISSTQGTTANNSNLINFNLAKVTASPGNGAIRFEDTGSRTGRCYLTCHGEDHDGWDY